MSQYLAHTWYTAWCHPCRGGGWLWLCSVSKDTLCDDLAERIQAYAGQWGDRASPWCMLPLILTWALALSWPQGLFSTVSLSSWWRLWVCCWCYIDLCIPVSMSGVSNLRLSCHHARPCKDLSSLPDFSMCRSFRHGQLGGGNLRADAQHARELTFLVWIGNSLRSSQRSWWKWYGCCLLYWNCSPCDTDVDKHRKSRCDLFRLLGV